MWFLLSFPQKEKKQQINIATEVANWYFFAGLTNKSFIKTVYLLYQN